MREEVMMVSNWMIVAVKSFVEAIAFYLTMMMTKHRPVRVLTMNDYSALSLTFPLCLYLTEVMMMIYSFVSSLLLHLLNRRSIEIKTEMKTTMLSLLLLLRL